MNLEHSEQLGDLGMALAKAQSDIGVVIKGKTAKAGSYSYTYADLADSWEAVREALTSNGLSLMQFPTGDGVTTMLLHSSGQWVRGHLVLPPQKHDPQSMGSAITYARRYALQAVVGLAADDDDGAGAMQSPPQRRQAPPPQRSQQAGDDMPERLRKMVFARMQDVAANGGPDLTNDRDARHDLMRRLCGRTLSECKNPQDAKVAYDIIYNIPPQGFYAACVDAKAAVSST